MLIRLLSLTLAGTFTLALLMAAEALFPRFFTARWRYYARLAVLVSFAAPITVPTFFTQARAASTLPIFWEAPVQALSEFSGALAIPAAPPNSALPKLAVVVWAATAAVLLLWRLSAWLHFCAAVRRTCVPAGAAEHAVLAECMAALHSKIRVRLVLCPGIGAPALAGVLRPVILLPYSGIPADELRCILLHELTHLHRADIAYKLATLAVNALHWFNPLTWLLMRQIGELCELSCDEAVVRGFTREQRKQYGLAILNQIGHAHSGLPQSVPAFSAAKQNILKRLDIIMKLPNLSKKNAVLASVAALILCTAGATAALALAPSADASASGSALAVFLADGERIPFSSPIADDAGFRYVSVSFSDNVLPDHQGTDIVAPDGTSILAAAAGTVAYVQQGGDSPYGNHIILDHGNGYQTLYAHCDKLLVQKGDAVTQKQVIATVGETGYATGPHLHFEVRKGTDPIDAQQLIEITNIAPTK